MKKTYCKPKAVVQDMAVNCFVAGACSDAGVPVLNSTENTCSYRDPYNFMVYFSFNCEADNGKWGVNIVNPNPNSPYAQLCYHRPLDDLSFFNS